MSSAPQALKQLHAAPRCRARTRAGHPCRTPAMRNGRCRMHGGASTGPRTPEGLERCRMANFKHGMRSAEVITLRRQANTTRRALHDLIDVAENALMKQSPPRG